MREKRLINFNIDFYDFLPSNYRIQIAPRRRPFHCQSDFLAI